LCAKVVQKPYNSVGSADREGQERDGSLVHKSFQENECLVKAKPLPVRAVPPFQLVSG